MPHAASVIGGVRVLPHESIVDRLVALENLVVHLALIVVPDLATGLREHGLDRQQVSHLVRLEDAPLRIDEGDAFALEREAALLSTRPWGRERNGRAESQMQRSGNATNFLGTAEFSIRLKLVSGWTPAHLFHRVSP
jgi:hypothetical protein